MNDVVLSSCLFKETHSHEYRVSSMKPQKVGQTHKQSRVGLQQTFFNLKLKNVFVSSFFETQNILSIDYPEKRIVQISVNSHHQVGGFDLQAIAIIVFDVQHDRMIACRRRYARLRVDFIRLQIVVENILTIETFPIAPNLFSKEKKSYFSDQTSVLVCRRKLTNSVLSSKVQSICGPLVSNCSKISYLDSFPNPFWRRRTLLVKTELNFDCSEAESATLNEVAHAPLVKLRVWNSYLKKVDCRRTSQFRRFKLIVSSPNINLIDFT